MNICCRTTSPDNNLSQDYKSQQPARDLIHLKNKSERTRAVVAGVDYKENTDVINDNVATDHYINIVGYGTDKKGQYFSYYDNAAIGGEESGTNTKENRLYYDKKTNAFIDESSPLGGKYRLTEVRPTHTKEVEKLKEPEYRE
ncbi:hypothetical protein TRIP_D50055 [uncultured Paludibacter sp.]|nr:hypothetical protein TRIP_D50055 [uncultured Paludibacter sp.]